MISENTTTEVKCIECESADALLWRPCETEANSYLCQDCYELKEIERNETETDTTEKDDDSKDKDYKRTEQLADGSVKLRKSTRNTRFRSSKPSESSGHSNGDNKMLPKGKGRRSLFKKVPKKRDYSGPEATTRIVKTVFYKGSYFQIGDVISVTKNNRIYYAQIRGLMIDSYGEKSAFLTWLIPTQSSPDPNQCFDPATYLIGPDEDFARKLSYLTFVMHAPSDYYLDRTTPFPLPETMRVNRNEGKNFIWTSLPKIVRARK